MKNAISYFYNMAIDDIHQNSEMFYFDYNGVRYVLVQYSGNPSLISDIYNLQLELLGRGVYVHQMILNKDGQIITFINGLPYILMRLFNYNDSVSIEQIIEFSTLTSNVVAGNRLNRTEWSKLWAEKIDYLEYEINQLGQKYSSVRDSFSYFIGLGETSIQLFNMFFGDETKHVIAGICVSHDRIGVNNNTFDLYNPLNFIIDYRVRDGAEYIKNKFFAGQDVSMDVNNLLLNSNYTRDEHLLFFIRLLYPSYYFDLYENIIIGDADSLLLKKITDKVDDFQILLRYIYRYYKNIIQLPTIEWLE